jgi:pimeloyl-ACP methyl ester carboxylesterase
VKDHEAVRVALGGEAINFLGLSYGSQLGAQYAAMFPNNVRTLALDGILQHSQSEAANALIESSSYELVLHRFFKWAAKNESSALKGQDVEKLWESLIEKATATPIPASKCNGTDCYNQVTAEDITFNAQSYLTFAGSKRNVGGSWKVLSSALLNASHGDATALSTSLNSPENIAFIAITCLDWTHSDTTLAALRAKQIMVTEYAPLTRGASQSWILQHACLGWPAPIKNPPKKLDVKTSATILLSSSTADPSCGLPWALGMLEELENSVLVLREGAGHTSFTLAGETQKVIEKYLITGKAPNAGLITNS